MINFTTSIKFKDILHFIENEYGEISDFIVEDNIVGFSVYKCYFDSPLKEIQISKHTKLVLIDKYDDPCYSLSYKILNFN
jgi:hypothetical protein